MEQSINKQMEQIIAHRIYCIFALMNYVINIFGNFPYDIIKIIIMEMAPRLLLSCGTSHTILLIDSNAYAWGSNEYGQLGLGHNTDQDLPQKIDLKDIIVIECGGHYTVAINKFNKVYSWGNNEYGQLGLKTTESQNLPQEVDLKNISKIACGMDHTVAVTNSGRVYAWGDNMSCQLGIAGTPIDIKYYSRYHEHKSDSANRRTTPTKLKLRNIENVSCGSAYTMVLNKSGRIYGWGENWDGQLGLGHNEPQYLPQKLPLVLPPVLPSMHEDSEMFPDYPRKGNLTMENVKIVELLCGSSHTMAITNTNEVYTWGYNKYGQLGLGDNDYPSRDGFGTTCCTHRDYPHKLDSKNIKLISGGIYHTVAVDNFNNIYAWGYNKNGQLGLGHNKKRNLPEKLSLHLGNIASICCGDYNTTLVTESGEVYQWGKGYQNFPQKFIL